MQAYSKAHNNKWADIGSLTSATVGERREEGKSYRTREDRRRRAEKWMRNKANKPEKAEVGKVI